jgi:hypothetical protein
VTPPRPTRAGGTPSEPTGALRLCLPFACFALLTNLQCVMDFRAKLVSNPVGHPVL